MRSREFLFVAASSPGKAFQTEVSCSCFQSRKRLGLQGPRALRVLYKLINLKYLCCFIQLFSLVLLKSF